jgi:PAS domain S-box-containing protein
VAGGCYLGASLGTWLSFDGAGPAILFPPYAVVTAALLRLRPRYWWIVLLAGTVGDFVPHRLGGASVSFVLMAELVNHLRAVLAAIGIRRYVRALSTRRDMAIYMVIAVLVAPAVAALAGAGVALAHGRGEPFWLIWQQWYLANAITGLTLLPVLALGPGTERFRPVRILEAALLAAVIVVAGLWVFGSPYDLDRTGAREAHLYWALPTLLWAAVRFGVRGTSVTLLAVSVLSIWAGSEARGPFSGQSATENLLELQVFLVAVSVPLLVLAALIDEQGRTAAELGESRRQYRSIVEDQTEMICRFRRDGSYTFANAAYGETFGVDPHQLLGGGDIWSLVPAGVHPTPAELDALTPASRLATREVRVVSKEGDARWQQWRERGLFDERGVIVEYQAVGRDVTDRKHAEDKQRELEARKAAEASLVEAHRRKDEFLAMLGHELRNPLAPIGLALEVLREARADDEDAIWARESIQRHLDHMTRLLDDLLDISRVTRGKIQLKFEPVDLGRVVADAVEATRPVHR